MNVRFGFGREMGIHALENYTQVKNVIIQLHHSAWGQHLARQQISASDLKLVFGSSQFSFF